MHPRAPQLAVGNTLPWPRTSTLSHLYGEGRTLELSLSAWHAAIHRATNSCDRAAAALDGAACKRPRARQTVTSRTKCTGKKIAVPYFVALDFLFVFVFIVPWQHQQQEAIMASAPTKRKATEASATFRAPDPGRPIVAGPQMRSPEAIEYCFRTVLESISSSEVREAVHPPYVEWREPADEEINHGGRHHMNLLRYVSPLDVQSPLELPTTFSIRRMPSVCAAICQYAHSVDDRNKPGREVEACEHISWEQDWAHGWPFLRRVLLRLLQNSARLHASGHFEKLPKSGACPFVILLRPEPPASTWPLEIWFGVGLQAPGN